MGGTRSRIATASALLVVAVALAGVGWLGVRTARTTIADVRAARSALPETLASPEAVYAVLGYRVADIRKPGAAVPRVYLHALPKLLPRVHDYGKRKSLFLSIVLPHVLAVNEQVAADRARLLDLKARIATGQGIDSDDAFWLTDLAGRYGLATADMDALLLRVAPVPPSLALAQAALESGWGTSRAAQQDNALFGQMATDGDGTDLAGFPSLTDGVAAYIHNLNSHAAYGKLRALRANKPPSGPALAKGLSRYSERRHDYARAVRAMIRANRLDRLDGARLASPGAETWTGPKWIGPKWSGDATANQP